MFEIYRFLSNKMFKGTRLGSVSVITFCFDTNQTVSWSDWKLQHTNAFKYPSVSSQGVFVLNKNCWEGREVWCNQLITSMQPSPTWKVTEKSVDQEFLKILLKPNFQYRVQKSRYLFLSCAKWMKPFPPCPIYLRWILILSSLLHLGLLSGLFPSGSATKTFCASLFSPSGWKWNYKGFLKYKVSFHITIQAIFLNRVDDKKRRHCCYRLTLFVPFHILDVQLLYILMKYEANL
jgi:hypothetical protein